MDIRPLSSPNIMTDIYHHEQLSGLDIIAATASKFPRAGSLGSGHNWIIVIPAPSASNTDLNSTDN